MGNNSLCILSACRVPRAFLPILCVLVFDRYQLVFGGRVSLYLGTFPGFLRIFYETSSALNNSLALGAWVKTCWGTFCILFALLARVGKFFELPLAHRIYCCMEANKIFVPFRDVRGQIDYHISDSHKQLASRRKMPQPRRKSFCVPRMEAVDRRTRKIVGVQNSSNAFLKAANAEKSVASAVRFPDIVAHHVPLPFSFMAASAFTGAGSRVCAAVLAYGAHFCSRRSSTSRLMTSDIEIPSSSARFSSHFICDLVKTMERCMVFMWTSYTLVVPAVNPHLELA